MLRLACAVVLLAAMASATAQEKKFPARPIEMIVRTAPAEAEPAMKPMPPRTAVIGPPGGSKNGPAANMKAPTKKATMIATANPMIAATIPMRIGKNRRKAG